MAPIKFEEQLKDKLEKRSLQPSIDSWAKLSERLDAEEKNSKKPWLGWLSIAAGIIILLSVLIQTFGAKDVQDTTPQFVEEDTIENTIKKQLPISNDNESIELAIEDEIIDSEVNGNEIEKEPAIINYKSVAEKSTKTQVVINDANAPKLEMSIKKSNSNDLSKTEIEKASINKEAIVEALNELKAEKATATDREVDSLLKLASKELVKDKLLKETNKTVDAQSLLEDVEDEMGQSFRSKVYEALKDGYKTVKTAVAQRNN